MQYFDELLNEGMLKCGLESVTTHEYQDEDIEEAVSHLSSTNEFLPLPDFFAVELCFVLWSSELILFGIPFSSFRTTCPDQFKL